MSSSPRPNSSVNADLSPSLFPTVESFRFTLQGWEQVLNSPSPARWLEAQLLARLGRPIRLLRWAVVRVDQPKGPEKFDASGVKSRKSIRFLCEGAYLRRPSASDNKPDSGDLPPPAEVV